MQLGAGTGHHNEMSGYKKRLIRLPCGDFRKGILTDNEMYVGFRTKLFLEVSQGLDSIRQAGTSQFHVRDLKGGFILDSQADHFQAILSIGHMVSHLMRGVGGWDQQESVEVENLPDFYRSPEMAEVDWIESTAKKA